jgi:hypothetical protein
MSAPAYVDLRGARLESILSGRAGAAELRFSEVVAYLKTDRGLVSYDTWSAALTIELLETASFSWVRSLEDKNDFVLEGSFKDEAGRDVPMADFIGGNLPARSLELNFKSGATARFKFASARMGSLDRRERLADYDGPLPPLIGR